MNENPWYQLPETPPYLLLDDKDLVQSFNATAGPNRFLHIDDILPEPFVGAKDAPVVLLSNNPGVGKGAAHKKDPIFLDRMRKNLHHWPSDYPFVYLAPDISGPHRQWWVRKLKGLLQQFGDAVIARSILNIAYFPYPSQAYGHGAIRLVSQAYSFHLVREALKRKAVVVRMRKNEKWFSDVPGLSGYERLYRVENWQNPAISPANCRDFEKVVQAIAAAEAKRRA